MQPEKTWSRRDIWSHMVGDDKIKEKEELYHDQKKVIFRIIRDAEKRLENSKTFTDGLLIGVLLSILGNLFAAAFLEITPFSEVSPWAYIIILPIISLGMIYWVTTFQFKRWEEDLHKSLFEEKAMEKYFQRLREFSESREYKIDEEFWK